MIIIRKDFFVFNKVLSLELCPGNTFQMDGQTSLLKTSNKIVQVEMVSGFPQDMVFSMILCQPITNFISIHKNLKKEKNKTKQEQNKKQEQRFQRMNP